MRTKTKQKFFIDNKNFNLHMITRKYLVYTIYKDCVLSTTFISK